MKPAARAFQILLALAFAAPTLAARSDLSLAQSGGGIGQSVTFRLEGEASRPYLLWFDVREVKTKFPSGIVTSVGFDFLPLSFALPGFIDLLLPDGSAVATAALPNDAFLADLSFSFQSIYTDVLDGVSNVTRLTPGFPGTFRDTLEPPLIPILSGVASPQADGSFLLIDTTLPLVQRYVPALEEFDDLDVSCLLGLLATTTTLEDGRVLMTGGLDLATGQPQTKCLLLDPVALTCTELHMGTPRAGHAVARAENGQLLISGGFTDFDLTDVTTLFSGITTSTEIFDPATGTFAPARDMLEPKAFHSATTTAKDEVLLAGGLTLVPIVDIPLVSPLAYLYDPSTDRFSLPILMNEARMLHGGALLDDDTVLLAGGITIDFSEFLSTGNLEDLALIALATGDLWKDNFLGGNFTKIDGMQRGRALPAMTALPGARALVAGGFDLSITGTDVEQWVFDPQRTADLYSNKAFSATGRMKQARIAPIAIALADGTVLVVGGAALDAEVYQP